MAKWLIKVRTTDIAVQVWLYAALPHKAWNNLCIPCICIMHVRTAENADTFMCTLKTLLFCITFRKQPKLPCHYSFI